MAHVTAQTVSVATGLPVGADGVDGACEKAVLHEDEARVEARRRLGKPIQETLEGYFQEGLDGEHGARVERYITALSLLCLALALPTLNLRSVQRGGFVRATGHDDSREELLSPDQSLAVSASLRERAYGLLDALADEIAPEIHAADPTPVIWNL